MTQITLLYHLDMFPHIYDYDDENNRKCYRNPDIYKKGNERTDKCKFKEIKYAATKTF